jgi:hypothetical protein
MGQEVLTHPTIGNELFDSIGKDLPYDVIAKINAEAQAAAEKALPHTSGTSYHLAIAIGYKLAKVNSLK